MRGNLRVCPLLPCPRPRRSQTLTNLASLQFARRTGAAEVLALIDREHMFGLSCGIVNMHLITTTSIRQCARLWTLDKRPDMLAERFGAAQRTGAHGVIGTAKNSIWNTLGLSSSRHN